MRRGARLDPRPWRRLAALFLFYVPVLYVGVILAVAVHEIAGHGLAALALGGSFRGFGLYYDGMGWANVDANGLKALGKAVMLSAGGASTAIAAALLIAGGAALRKRPFAQAALSVLGFVCLMDGVPYLFWDAIFLSGVGDFSGIFKLYPDHALRAAAIGLCGSLMAFGIAAFNFLIWRLSRRILGQCLAPGIKARIALAVPLFAMQAAGWFAFDWSELVPGTGALPADIALALTAASLLGPVLRRSAARAEERARPADEVPAPGRENASEAAGPSRADAIPLRPAILAWAAAAAAALMTLLWSGKGVYF